MFGEKDNQAGFSVVELLITLIIIGVAFGAFTVIFTTIQTINKKATDISVANTLAFSKMQEYENKTFSAINTTSPYGSLILVEDFSSTLPSSLQSPRVGQVFVNTVSASLKQIIVNVTYGNSADQRQLQYADFIQTNGLGR